MLPQLNLSSWQEPSRSSSRRTSGSAVQGNASSGKFEEAMEMYHQSMAIRRREMSTSNSTKRSSDCMGGESAELSTMQSSTSLRGPQLRPSARLIRVNASTSSPSPQRPGCRLPSVVSQSLPSSRYTPDSVSTAASAHHLHSNRDSDSTACTAVVTQPTAVARRSTRRPLSRNPALNLQKSSDASGDTSVTTSRPSGSPNSTNDGIEKSQRRAGSLPSDSNAPTRLHKEGTASHVDSVMSSVHSLLHSPLGEVLSEAAQQTSILQRHGSNSKGGKPKDGNGNNKEPALREQSSEGLKCDAFHDPCTGSYDVIGFDAMLMTPYGGAAAPRRPSPCTPEQSRVHQPQQPATEPLKPKAPLSQPVSTIPRRYSLICDSTQASTNLLQPEPNPPLSSAAGPLVALLPSAEHPSKKASSSFPQNTASSAVQLSSMITFNSPSLSNPAVAEKPRPTPSASGAVASSKKSTTDATGRSASQAGLSSAINISESRNGSRATCEASQRGSTAPSRRTSASTEAGVSVAAAAASPIGMMPVPGAPTPGLTPAANNQTAKFYATASLAKTYDGSQFLNDYILLGEIGSGATGRVMLAFSTSMMCSVAIKIILKPREKKYCLQRSRCSSDSSTALSSSSKRLDSSDAGKAAEPSAHLVTASIPVPSNGRYGGAAGGITAPGPATPSTTASPSRRRSVSNPTRLTTAERITRNLQREIEVMKDLNHPNIVRLYEVINDPKANSLFLILQYVDSGAIAQINSSGCIPAAFSPAELLPIAAQVADGLAYLHEHRIVHRDIKPENILVNRSKQAFLADFGVAELMNAEAGLPTAATLAYQGTPLFMAPEIYAADDDEGDDVDLLQVDVSEAGAEGKGATAPAHPGKHGGPATTASTATARHAGRPTPRTIDPYALDVWALGVTFYTLLVGRVPFHSMLQIRQAARSGVVIPASVPDAWCRILRCTMEPDVSRRVTSALLKEVLHAMQDAAEAVGRGNSNPRTGEQDANAALRDQTRQNLRDRSRGPSRQPAPTAARAMCRATDDEDIILGSGTPEETTLLHANDGRLAGDSEDIDGNFSINSSIMNVLRPARR
ncbi:protein kinase [Leptomonas seymouri]|uniref:Protein kinase n=1 Tax=Leptomonas seymouri TaxID=5684 RepID=A0A0N0P2U5_LEPSE|nr:protein kinase [Leptomonas seymouri]|eukprot:KPI82907.1 protein kinase [Leptomonas seymouri]